MNAIDKLTSRSDEGALNVIVETPAGSTSKLKWEPKLGLFTWSRPLPLGISYPHDWGFVPGTLEEDGDPLDALVLSEGSTFPGLLIAARPIGVIYLEQNAEGGGRQRNDRIVAVAQEAPRREIASAADLPERVRSELEQFFLDATYFEAKDAKLLGWGDADEAWAAVTKSSQRRSRKRSR